jgi:uncharacterized protein (TIGR02452 family)
MSLVGVANQTLQIVKQGVYQSKNGLTVQLKTELQQAMAGTRLYTPEELARHLQTRQARTGKAGPPKLEVTSESTAQAARRLYQTEGETKVVALNFASAKNPGGGFLGELRLKRKTWPALPRCTIAS